MPDSARHYIKIHSFNGHHHPTRQRLLLLPFYRSREVQNGDETCSNSRSQHLVKLGFNTFTATLRSGYQLGWTGPRWLLESVSWSSTLVLLPGSQSHLSLLHSASLRLFMVTPLTLPPPTVCSMCSHHHSCPVAGHSAISLH